MNNNNFNLICKSINNGVLILDKNLNIKYWNRWLEDFTHIKESDILNTHILKHYSDINIKNLHRKIKTALLLKTPTFYNTSKNGYLLKIKLNNVIEQDYNYMQQNITILPYDLKNEEVIIYIYDNTQLKNLNLNLDKTKKELEEKNKILEQQNTEFEQLFNMTMEGILLSDHNNVIQNVNNIILKQLGFINKEDLIGKNILEFIIPKYHDKVKLNKLNNYEIEIQKINNTIFPAFVTSKNIYLNNIKYKLYMIIDISDLKAKEKQLFEQAKLASMGEMIGNIAHQWRQPLTVISTAATGMQIQKELGILGDEKFNKICEDINKNAQYLSQTIDDFKNFIKGESIRKKFLLNDEINSFLHLIEGSKNSANIKIILDVDSNITIFAFENQLTQCLINLFNNAKDALIENKIENRLIFITAKKIDETITISIKDNANGIDNNIKNKIFEPYFTTKHQSQGTGLGLHMTHRLIVEGMNGDIEVKNETYTYNQQTYTGACFKITLESE